MCNNLLVKYQNWLKIEIFGNFIHSITQIIFFTKKLIVENIQIPIQLPIWIQFIQLSSFYCHIEDIWKKKMEEVLNQVLDRFPSLGEDIFNQLDNQDLTKCKEIAKS